MANLDIGEATEKKLAELENGALDILIAFFKGNREYGDDVKMAIQSMNIVAKNRGTLTAREGVRFGIVSAITDDPAKLKKYVKATNPQISKLLSA